MTGRKEDEDDLVTSLKSVPVNHKTSWKSLFDFSSRQHGVILVLALSLSVTAGMAAPALAIFFGKLFDSFSLYGGNAIDGDDFMRKVTRNCIALCILGATLWTLKGGFFGLWMIFGELQANEARDRLFESLLEKDVEWYEMRPSGIGALLPRLQTQIRELQISTSQPLGFSIQYIVQMLASLGLAFYTSWKLTLVILAAIPISALILPIISSSIQPNIMKQEIQLSIASKLVTNALSAIDTVKCYNGQGYEFGQYGLVVIEAARYYLRQAISNSLQIGFVRFVATSMFVQGFWYGSHLVSKQQSSANDVITTFWACLMATKAVEDILPQMLLLERGRSASAAMKSILEQVNRGSKVDNRSGNKSPQFCEGDIEIRNVSFSYPSRPDHFVLSESTFFFPAGESTFVVGKSGSGKSTIANLLMRFYEPTEGDVLIDGYTISELDLNWLRNNISLVQQKTMLFDETIFRNVSFGLRDYKSVTKEMVSKCIDFAALESTVKEMAQGLDTQVGSGGSALSGGQKQRIAIARARLRDTPILILDESTSALDQTGRKMIMNAIRDWRKGKTTIIITHDLGQIRGSDFVYVLEDGRIIENTYRHAIESLDKARDSNIRPSTPSDEEVEFPFKPELGLQRRRTNPFSNISLVTRMSLMRRDSLEKRLDEIEESPSGSSPCTPSPVDTGASGQSQADSLSPVKRSRSVLTKLRTSTYLPAPAGIEMRRLSSLAPTASQMHRTLSRTSRPMSIHQAVRLGTIYGGALDPANSSTFIKPASREPRSPLSPSRALLHGPKLLRRRSKQPVPEKRSSIKSILRTVWPSLSVTKRIRLISGFIFAVIHAGATPAFSFVFSELLGTFFIKEDRARKALIYSMAILGIAIVDALAAGLMHYTLEDCGQAWVDKLRLQAYERILDQPKSWFSEEDNDLLTLTSSLDRNAEEMRNLIGRFAPFIVVVAAMMIIAIAWSTIVCWKVTLVAIAAAPSLYFITKAFEAVSSKWENGTNTAAGEAGSIFVEIFSDIRTTRALTLEAHFHRKYNAATRAALNVGVQRAAYCGFFFGASDSAINFVTALVFWYGARVAREGDFSVKSILTVFAMLLFSTANANAVIAYIPQISSSADTATRLLRLSNLPLHKSHESAGTVVLDVNDALVLAGPITFRNLTFTYPTPLPSTPALSNLSLTIPPGKITALVGSSGSGKSTIASLLLGLYPIPCSNITTENILTLSNPPLPLSTISLPHLRRLLIPIPQSPTLFSTTLLNNITYGLPLLSPLSALANVHHAATLAGIHDFITSLPHGYGTVVGDGGLGLSGGQAQRVAVARALVRRPRVLVMDEATGSLDRDAAARVREGVRGLMNERRRGGSGGGGRGNDGRLGRGGKVGEEGRMTVLAITHDEDTMAWADRVVVLERGRVVEEGGYRELMKRVGYGALWRLLRT